MFRRILFFFSVIFLMFYSFSAFARSGCCSWHGGVCGCGTNGRQICCDGQYSPTCMCNPSPQKRIEDVQNIEIPDVAEAENMDKTCQYWAEIYKDTSILKGEYSNIKKADYLNSQPRCKSLWSALFAKINYCSTRECYVEKLGSKLYWEETNTEFNNLILYLSGKYKSI